MVMVNFNSTATQVSAINSHTINLLYKHKTKDFHNLREQENLMVGLLEHCFTAYHQSSKNVYNLLSML